MYEKNFRGLTLDEVKIARRKFGINNIEEKSKSSIYKIFKNQIKNNFVIYLLLSAVVLSLLVGKTITAITISGVILLVVGTGFFQEYKAEKAVSALKSLLTHKSRVIRDGKEVLIDSTELVPNDILLLSTGDKIPADGVVLDEKGVTVDESILTGESNEVEKKRFSPENPDEKAGKVFMGTFVTSGNCVVKVTAIGMQTEFGKIAGLLQESEKVLPLQKKVNMIAKYMVALAFTVSILTGIIYIIQSGPVTLPLIESTLILVIALSVSAFPEGFPVVLTTTLAVGVMRMAKRNAIVNRMSVIESLGETTVIATDKTGTVTRGEMTVKKILLDDITLDVTGVGYQTEGKILLDGSEIDVNENEQLKKILLVAALCNNASFVEDENENRKISGSATDSALLVLTEKTGIRKDNSGFVIKEEIPFTSERKMMSVLVQSHESFMFTKGAPEIILSKCNAIQIGNEIKALTEEMTTNILSKNSELTVNAYRTIGFAYKVLNGENNEEDGLIFLGIAALEDAPREEIAESIEACKRAGIVVKLITGDHKETAQAIARQIGISDKVITGNEIEKLTDEQLKVAVVDTGVFARVMPEQKLKIVKALKENGEIVAMTGDGVNDAPALEEAHVGIAMGRRGTDVARSASDLILKDDNFATIVAAIVEGRTIFNNMRKFTTYQLSCNLAELMTLFIATLLAPILSWSVPLLVAIQILFMNLVTDNLPAITLGLNKASKDIMYGKFKKNMSILDRKLFFVVVITGFLMAGIVLASYYLSFNLLHKDERVARTLALVTLIIVEICAAFVFRSFRKGVLTRSPFSNKYLFIASILSIFATLMIVYTPLTYVFETVPITYFEWLIAIVLGFIFLLIYEILKIVNPVTKLLPAH